ncbi:MAG: ParA family protein [Ruminococcaceae bacterium]|nr:ParA family protein [Oscillospiraceae bacterium]
MGKCISVANQKGGVGKTTTSVNLASCLGSSKKKVLLIDLDPQGNATSGVGIDKEEVSGSVYDVLINNIPIKETIIKTEFENLSLCPAGIDLAGAEIEMVDMEKREFLLKNALENVKKQFDFIIIDCPPALGLLTLNAFVASDSLIMPIQCEYYALEGLSQLTQTVRTVKKQLNPEIEIEGVLLTMFDVRTNLSTLVAQEVKKYYKDKLYKTVIPRNVRLSEAPSYGQPINYYDKTSKGCECYLKLAKEVVKKNKNYSK